MRSKNDVVGADEEVMLEAVADLGALIRRRRESLSLTLRQVSAATGLSLAFVHAVEHGKETAEIGKVFTLGGMLGIDLIGRSR